MPENLLTLLNYLLLVLLYLFFARVLWTVWSEVRAARPAAAPPPGPPPAPAAPKARKAKAGPARPASRLHVVQPPDRSGSRYPLGEEITLGRAVGCQVSLPSDTYASNVHARLYVADGLTMVEDLGSTNGTFVNGERISGATAVKVGDRVQVGATVLEVE